MSHLCGDTSKQFIPSHTWWIQSRFVREYLSPLEKSFIVCCSCEGVMRDPQLTEEGYKCSSCLDGGEGKPMAVNKTEIEKLRVVCPFRQQGCKWSGTMGLVVTHVEKCDLCPVCCPLGCGHSSQRKNSKRHEQEECPERDTSCEFCQTSIKLSQTRVHFETCPNFPLKCSNGCNEDRIARKDLSLHLSEICPLTLVPCAYKKYGCVDVKREDVNTHEMDSVVKHVRMMNTQIESLTSHNELMSTQIESYKSQVKTLTSRNELMSTRINRMDEICTAIIPTKGLEWEIKGIRENFEKRAEVYSDPFYVSNYKFQGLAKFDTEDNNSLGIYLGLCVGSLDDSLKWPFLGKVTITLIDPQNSYFSFTKSYTTEGKDYFTRRTEDGTRYGYKSFVTKDEVLTEFSKDNSLRIKIRIKYSDKPEFTKRVTS